MSTCGICGDQIKSDKVHVCPKMLPDPSGSTPWRPWDSPFLRQSPPAELTWRQAWDAEIDRLMPEILRDPVAYALAHIATKTFDEYEAKIKMLEQDVREAG